MIGTALALLLALAVEPPAPPASAAPAPLAEPKPKPSATPREVLREIGRIRATTPFCRAFTEHFNNSARAMLRNDDQISYADFTLGAVERHFNQRAGELAFYDDRVKLAAYVKTMLETIPQLQTEINDLRKSAALTADPDSAKAAHEVAAELQRSLDHQRQVAQDSGSVVRAMMDYELGNTLTLEHMIHPWSESGPRASTRLQTSVPGGYNDYETSNPPARRDVRSYLRYEKQINVIGEAESKAVTTAQAVAEKC